MASQKQREEILHFSSFAQEIVVGGVKVFKVERIQKL